MDEQEREIAYWLGKLLLLNLQENGLLSAAEANQIRKRLMRKYKPVIGSLDGEKNEKRKKKVLRSR